MQSNRVVIRFKDGTIIKGSTSDLFPNKTHFHLNHHLDGKIEPIDVEELKAVFFVKDYKGNKDHKKKYDDEFHGAGRKIIVDFNDGESIIGYALGYSSDRKGFFITPADLNGNNERVFIVKSATKSIKFMS